jgi:hypothetical protein
MIPPFYSCQEDRCHDIYKYDDDVYDLLSTSSSNRVYPKQIHTESQLFVALPTVLQGHNIGV